MQPARRRATYEDVLRAPPNEVAEVLNGELVLHPRPAGPHAAASSALGAQLWSPFHGGRGGPGGWLILDEPELHLRDDIVVPDLAGWKRSTLPKVPNAAFITVAPDWVCEVLSPSTERVDRADKLPIYAAQRVSHAWLVNPIQQTLEVLRRADTAWLTVAVHREQQIVRVEPFDAIELELGLLWADVDLEPPSR